MKNVFVNTISAMNQTQEINAKAYLGECLRKKRQALGKTLSETSAGICSTSYLSKLENNQMKHEKHAIDRLADRLGLTLTVVEDELTLNPLTEKALVAYYRHDHETLNQLIEAPIDPMFETSKDIVKGIKAILSKDFETAGRIVESVYPRFRSLPFKDNLALGLLIMMQSYHMREYQKSLQLIRLVNTVAPEYDTYQFLMNYYAYLTLEKTHQKRAAQRFYERAVELGTLLFSSYFRDDLNIQHVYFLNQEDAQHVYDHYIRPGHLNVKEEFQNMQTLIELENAIILKKDWPSITLNEAVKDDAYYRIKVLNAMYYKQFDTSSFKDVSIVMTPHKVMFDLAKIKNKDARINYIRFTALPVIKEMIHLDYARRLYAELSDFQLEKNRYKEAFSVLEQHKKFERKLTLNY